MRHQVNAYRSLKVGYLRRLVMWYLTQNEGFVQNSLHLQFFFFDCELEEITTCIQSQDLMLIQGTLDCGSWGPCGWDRLWVKLTCDAQYRTNPQDHSEEKGRHEPWRRQVWDKHECVTAEWRHHSENVAHTCQGLYPKITSEWFFSYYRFPSYYIGVKVGFSDIEPHSQSSCSKMLEKWSSRKLRILDSAEFSPRCYVLTEFCFPFQGHKTPLHCTESLVVWCEYVTKLSLNKCECEWFLPISGMALRKPDTDVSLCPFSLLKMGCQHRRCPRRRGSHQLEPSWVPEFLSGVEAPTNQENQFWTIIWGRNRLLLHLSSGTSGLISSSSHPTVLVILSLPLG